MKTTILFITLAAALSKPVQAGPMTFDDSTTGKTPAGWTAAITGKSESAWTVEKSGDAPSQPNALKQSAETPNGSFPLCVKDDTAIADGHVGVKFKALTGKIDQAGGVVWRYTDENNYYVCRANALEDNVVLYKVENGKRSSLEIVGRKGGYGVDAKVPGRKWNTLRVDFKGTRFKVSLNGKELFEVDDASFSKAGKVGLWTKADSVTLFDDFEAASE
jgi:hypothetical protein